MCVCAAVCQPCLYLAYVSCDGRHSVSQSWWCSGSTWCNKAPWCSISFCFFSHVLSEEDHQCSISKNISADTNCLINGRQWSVFRWRSNSRCAVSLLCLAEKPNNAPAFKSPDILFCSTLMQQLPTICRSAAVLRRLASFLLLLCSLFCPSCHLSAAVFLWHSSLY